MRWSMLLSCFAMIFAFNVEAADYALLHGMGQTGGGDKEAMEYWGGNKSGGHCTRRSWGRCKSRAPISYNVANYLSGSKHAPVVDSTSRGWDNAGLQNEYYGNAKGHKKVIAHSMGNTTLAAACYSQGKCVKWHNTQGPILGSNAANTADTLCNSWWWKWNAGVIVRLVGFCTTASYSLRTDKAAFQSGTYQSKAKKQTASSFCGYDTNFWAGGSNAGLSVLSNLIPGQNDGLVPLWSCKVHNDSNVKSEDCDHLQGTGRQGNCGGVQDWMK